MNARLRLLAGPLAILLLATLTALLSRPLTPVDETRYVGVAWEMWLRGDWLVPFKNGEPYSHKPPLLFWLYDLGWWLFGVNDWWPRLISPLFSLGSLWLTLSLAQRLWPQQEATQRNALWILSASLLWLAFSTAAMFDVVLSFFVLLGMRGLLIAADASPMRGFAWFAVAIGCGILVKGPVVLLHLLPAAALAPWWAAEHKLRWKRWYGAILLAFLGGAAIALLWAVPAGSHGGEEYRRAIFWGQTANRMVESFAHRRPFWWYLPWLPLILFPWLLWPTLWRSFKGMVRERLDFGQRFCLAWMLPVFVAFSLISGKQVHYLLPLFPSFALLAGHFTTKSRTSGTWLPALVSLSVTGVMLYLAFAGLPRAFEASEPLPKWPGVVLLGWIALTYWLGRRDDGRVPALALQSAGLLVLLHCQLAPWLWQRYDARPIAAAIRSYQDKGFPVAHLGKYHDQFQFAGRLTQPLAELDGNGLKAWFSRHPQGMVVVYWDPRQPLPFTPLFSQPYRGKIALLLDAGQFAKYAEAVEPGG